jgi:hypothetical protein
MGVLNATEFVFRQAEASIIVSQNQMIKLMPE